ncbi:MAG: hypothetical protein H6625_00720 [Bdellovibrionaceae bacterium]|nr:hypothetical protein [Pseudobdellovibrionaceae bacterium]
MNYINVQFVDVFPITSNVFGLRSNWFEVFVPKLIQPTYLLMILMLVISIGIMTLKRFENANLVKKLWNLPIIITLVVIWPFLILGLKDLIDTFNTFIIYDIFQIQWKGFGFPSLGSISNIVAWSAEGLARLLPDISYWIIYSFYLVYFFFFAVIGPFILAKGILFDEIDAFLEIIKELTLLFLWQTTLAILVAFIMPDIVSGEPFPAQPKANFYFLSLILGIMILFVPAITRKFGNHLGSSIYPPGFRWMGQMLALGAVGKVSTLGLSALGKTVSPEKMNIWRHRILTAEEFRKRYKHQHETLDLMSEKAELEHKLLEYKSQYQDQTIDKNIQYQAPHANGKNYNFIDNLKKAKLEKLKD